MAFFRKKADPLAQRADTLNRRIAELEAKIARLNQSAGPPPPDSPGPKSPRRVAGSPASEAEPAFEEIPVRSPTAGRSDPPVDDAAQMGLKRSVWWQRWHRWKGRFVDPPPANAKLVNYLAVGGIQGFRPLRYERRIARNRILFVCVVLGLLMWAILVMFWHTR